LSGDGEIFSLTGNSPMIPPSQLPGDGSNYAIIDIRSVGVRVVKELGGSNVIQFGVNTYGARAHPNYPAEFDVVIDTNLDGDPDYVMFNAPLGSTGTNVVGLFDISTSKTVAYYYTDVDLNSSNVILSAPFDALKMAPDTQFRFSVEAYDNYFTGMQTAAITDMMFRSSTPRYSTEVAQFTVPRNGDFAIKVTRASVPQESSSQSGLLLFYRNARAGSEAQAIRVMR
jgi:minor extracellular serine protease Vpr